MTPTANLCRQRGASMIRWSRQIALAPILTGLLVSIAAGKYGGGSGIVSDPYLIRTVEDVNTLGNTQADWDKCFRLMADLDLKAYDETNFHLIGYWSSYGDTTNRPFTGSFDGYGHTISNFHYKDMKRNGLGLFPYATTGEIKDLKLKNVKVVSDGTDIGSLVGHLGGGAVIRCEVTGVDVTGNTRVGGLVGSVTGTVSDCASRGRVTGLLDVGGLAGDVGQGTIKRCYSKASVSGNDSVGGLAGTTLNEASVVDSCYANGEVNGAAYAGGLVGQVGAGRVYRCYSTGPVTGNQPIGGLVGARRALGDVMASYWDTQTSGRSTSAGGTGMTTADMWSSATYVGWDWDGTWSICDGRNYPVFWWQIPTADLGCPDGVNWTDFARFAMEWERSDCGEVNSHCDWADIDWSGSVGFSDLAILAEEWLSGLY